jgi:polyketide synthase 12
LKSNIGHAQAASGMAAVIKMVMATRHGLLPKTLHVDEPTAQVDWESGNVHLLTETVEWPETGRPRRAGVSGYGISGTNVHLIIEQAPRSTSIEPPVDGHPRHPVPLVLSGRSVAALRGQAERLRAHLVAHADLNVPDVAFSLAITRSRFEHRGVVVADDRDKVLQGLAALAQGTACAGVIEGPTEGRAFADPRSVFVFPGQGSQWLGMASELLDTSPVFAAHIAECGDALAPHVEWSLLDVVRGSAARSLDRVDVVQPVLFAMLVSLAQLWRSYGVEPAAVVGHSQGEIAAACVAGALSLPDAAKVVALRVSR